MYDFILFYVTKGWSLIPEISEIPETPGNWKVAPPENCLKKNLVNFKNCLKMPEKLYEVTILYFLFIQTSHFLQDRAFFKNRAS